MTSKDEMIAAYRRRYDALKASGQAPKALPPPSARPAPLLDGSSILHRETIPGGWYWTTVLRAGEALRLQTGDSPSAVALLAWNKADPSERLNYADTVKVQWTAALQKGRVIFSDMGRVMLSLVEDSGAYHDALVGGSTAASNAKRYGGTTRNTRDNFVLAAQKLGLGPSDIPPCLSFFAPVRTDVDGRFVWHAGKRQPGDYVELRAEMDMIICPHPLDPAPTCDPGPVEVVRFRAPPAGADDPCRTATAEAGRGFENNAASAL
jgi:urea carboxylase-associated protein 2